MHPPLSLHGDHSKYIKNFTQRGIDAYSCKDVSNNIDNVATLEARQPYEIGEFIVTAYPAFHNVECYIYCIKHNECGMILFATDTNRMPYKLSGVNHMLVECNYDDDFIVDNAVSRDIWNSSHSENHLSLNKCIDCVKLNISKSLQNVILLHLSAQNIDETTIKDRFYEEAGINPLIAKKGLRIELNKEEF